MPIKKNQKSISQEKTQEFIIRRKAVCYAVENEDVSIGLHINSKDVALTTTGGELDFVFKNRFTPQNLDKWERVLQTMLIAVKQAKSEFKSLNGK